MFPLQFQISEIMVKSARPPSSPNKLAKFATMKTAMKRSPTQMTTLQHAAMACGPWEYCASVHARWPGLEGGANIISEIHKTYVLEENATLPWYKPNLQRALKRHRCNMDRNQHDTRKRYKIIVKEHGVLSSAHLSFTVFEA